ncbi:Serine/threonine-protein kinase [Sorochytrium milnesiophthora]
MEPLPPDDFKPASAPATGAHWLNAPSLRDSRHASAAHRQQQIITLNCGYTLGEEIGKGSFATVHRGLSLNASDVVAIKSIPVGQLTKKLLHNLNSEIQILQNMSALHNPNIVNLLAWERTDNTVFLVMEWCEWGDLSAFIKRKSLRAGGISSADVMTQKVIKHIPLTYDDLAVAGRWGGLDELLVKYFLGQLSDALHFLRVHSLMHRDLKPQNLLLHPPSLLPPAAPVLNDSAPFEALLPYLPVLKLADFGFARYLSTPSSLAETLCGSPLYMAPEILRYEKYDARADLWSVGAVLYESLFGRVPFRAQNHIELVRKIEKSKDRLKFPRGALGDSADGGESAPNRVLDENTVDLIKRLLKQKPATRMNFDEFFLHPAIVESRALATSIREQQTVPVTETARGAQTPSSARATQPASATPAPSLARHASAHPAISRASPMPILGKQHSAPSFDTPSTGIRNHHHPYQPVLSPVQQEFRPMSVPAPIPIPASSAAAAQRQLRDRVGSLPHSPSPSHPRASISTFETTHSSPSSRNSLSNIMSPVQTPPLATIAPPPPVPPLPRMPSTPKHDQAPSTPEAHAAPPSNMAQMMMRRYSSAQLAGSPPQSPTPPEAVRRISSPSSPRGKDKPMEKDYVVVEKKSVEVNAIADEMRAAVVGHGAAAVSTPFDPPSLVRKPSINKAIASVVSNLSARIWGKRSPHGSNGSSNDYLIVHSSAPPPAPLRSNGSSGRSTGSRSAVPASLAPPVSPKTQTPANLAAQFPQFHSTECAPDVSSLLDQLEAHARRAFALSTVVGPRTETLLQMLAAPPRSREYLQTIVQLSEEALIIDVRILAILSAAMALVRTFAMNAEDRFGGSSNSNAVTQSRAALSLAVEYIRALYNKTVEHSEMVRLSTTPDFDNPEDYFFSPAHSHRHQDRREAETEWLRWLYGANQIPTPRVEQLVYAEAARVYREAAAREEHAVSRSSLQSIERSHQLSVAMLESLVSGVTSAVLVGEDDDDDGDDGTNAVVHHQGMTAQQDAAVDEDARSGSAVRKDDVFNACTEADHVQITKLIAEISNRLAGIRAKIDASTSTSASGSTEDA